MERCSGLERETRSLQELLHKRDRMVRDEKRKADDALAQVDLQHVDSIVVLL